MRTEYESGLNPIDGKLAFADDFQRYIDQGSKSISSVMSQ